MAWDRPRRHGEIWDGLGWWSGNVWCGHDGLGWYGAIWGGLGWSGVAGQISHGLAWSGVVWGSGMVWGGLALHGVVSMVWGGLGRSGVAWGGWANLKWSGAVWLCRLWSGWSWLVWVDLRWSGVVWVLLIGLEYYCHKISMRLELSFDKVAYALTMWIHYFVLHFNSKLALASTRWNYLPPKTDVNMKF